MGLVALGPKWLRRIARTTGFEIVWGSGHGGYTLNFTTADHKHGWFDMRAYREVLLAFGAENVADTSEWHAIMLNRGVWALETPEEMEHFSSCSRLFPDNG